MCMSQHSLDSGFFVLSESIPIEETFFIDLPPLCIKAVPTFKILV